MSGSPDPNVTQERMLLNQRSISIPSEGVVKLGKRESKGDRKYEKYKSRH